MRSRAGAAGSAGERPAGAVEVAGVWYSGHVTRLAPGETPTLGATGPVAPPGAELAGLPAWVPVDGG